MTPRARSHVNGDAMGVDSFEYPKSPDHVFPPTESQNGSNGYKARS